ncbi:hypothetical protein BC777_0015 [Yoonia maricola]|uniref:Uncharacterized protein n=1 Tax=Yoonia maricola TaxID=420999 RepID=A0A2M8WJW1_9RHOB|nr:hypothetical protein [Yoonia maricola]PJI91193.1 hypothetical protein BC777_0015 [Yoonia maricola]
MSDKDTQSKTGKTAKTREDRLKAALKANMGKRKAQARARAAEPQKEKKE